MRTIHLPITFHHGKATFLMEHSGMTCPASTQYALDSQNPRFMADIFETYRMTRDDSPVTYVEALDLWVVTGRDQIISILKNNQDFSTARNFESDHELTTECIDVLQQSDYFTPSLLAMDPPGHTAMRDILASRFTPKAMKDLEPWLRHLVEQHVATFAEQEEADLVAELSYPLPMRVVGSLMGVPEHDHERIKAWHNQWMALLVVSLSPDEQMSCAHALVAYDRYYRALLQDRAAGPQDDLASLLARAVADGTCTASQAVAALRFFLAAGHETAMSSITNILYALMSHPEQWDRLVADPGLADAAVEEGLRYDSGAQGTTRYAMRDSVWGNVCIPAGARIHLMTGAPGRDPHWTRNAEAFDIERTERSRHHAFGYGIHFCLGAPLARLEARLVLESLSTWFPAMKLKEGFEPCYLPGGYMLRSMERLDLTLGNDRRARPRQAEASTVRTST